MASSSPLPPFKEAKATATTMMWQVYHQRPRTPRSKAIAYSVLAFLFFLFMLITSSGVSLLHYCPGLGHTWIANTIGAGKDQEQDADHAMNSNPSLISGPNFHRNTHSLRAPSMRRSHSLAEPILPSMTLSLTTWTSPTRIFMSWCPCSMAHAVRVERLHRP